MKRTTYLHCQETSDNKFDTVMYLFSDGSTARQEEPSFTDYNRIIDILSKSLEPEASKIAKGEIAPTLATVEISRDLIIKVLGITLIDIETSQPMPESKIKELKTSEVRKCFEDFFTLNPGLNEELTLTLRNTVFRKLNTQLQSSSKKLNSSLARSLKTARKKQSTRSQPKPIRATKKSKR